MFKFIEDVNFILQLVKFIYAKYISDVKFFRVKIKDYENFIFEFVEISPQFNFNFNFCLKCSNS